ncbi:hypothetical protein D3C75_789670 [compost metagenome]
MYLSLMPEPNEMKRNVTWPLVEIRGKKRKPRDRQRRLALKTPSKRWPENGMPIKSPIGPKVMPKT